jgi:serine/threonine-protein kinase
MSREPDSRLQDEDGTWHSTPASASTPQPTDKLVQHETIPYSGQTTPAPHQEGETQAPSDSGSNETPTPGRDATGEWDSLPTPIFEPGRVVFGKYRLLEKIGAGGMGDVWRVWHIDLETERALKLIKAEIAKDDKGWIRFKREAQLMAKIEHPNAVAVFDSKRTHSIAYIEMEFVRGRSLQDILKEKNGEPMPVEWTAKVLDQLCDLLQEAHGHLDEKTGKPAPIIHRDLKPSNLMLVERPDRPDTFRLKVLDFGIAKMIQEDGAQELTGPADLIGTPAYMSPEQIKSGFERSDEKQTVDGRSDLYSTGVVLYHLLTGNLPFRGNKMALLAAHLETPPLPMQEANPKAVVPSAVEAVVMQCLEKDPAKRPQSARALGDSFRKAMSGRLPGIPRPDGWTIPWQHVAAGVTATLFIAALAAVFLLFVVPPKPPVSKGSDGGTGGTNAGGATDLGHGGTGGTKRAPELWVPAGYVAVDPQSTVDGAPKLAKKLKRTADGVVFVHREGGRYLPTNYAPDPADPDNLVGSWPKVIVREPGPVRFIRIGGGTYKRGDPRGGNPELDTEGNPCTPHFVTVAGFYIQETEVTNGEIELYLERGHPEDEPNFDLWKRTLKGLTDGASGSSPISTEDAQHYPAAGVDYPAALRFAAWAEGSLPTESQWEFAAKSCNEENWYPWGNDKPANPLRPRGKFYTDESGVGPTAVKSFAAEGQDHTVQGVYDMAGNVRELCIDEYKSYRDIKADKYQSARSALLDERARVKPEATDPSSFKVVVRGGSFLTREATSKVFLRSAVRANDVPGYVGFRLVIECPEVTGPQIGAEAH